MYRGIVKRVSRQDIKLVTFSLEMEDKDQNKKKISAGELSEYITCLNVSKKPLHDVLGFRKEINGATVDIALQWCVDGYSYKMLGYANSIRTIDGGTHVDGVKASITRTLNSLAEKSKLVEDEGIIFREEHVMEGLTCIVSVCVPKPEFEGQTQTRLGNPYVREIVDQSVEEYLTEYFELHPDVLEGIISKSLNAYQTALAVKSVRDLCSSERVSTRRTIPKKLTNCSSEISEVFIGRGNASGGAAQHVPQRSFQSSKRTREQLWSDDAVSTSGASLENTSDSYVQKKSKQPKPCVQGSHPCSRKMGDVSNPPNRKEVSKKTSKDDINESKHPCNSRKMGDVSNRPNPKEVSKKTSKDKINDSKEKRAFIPIGPGFQTDIPVWIAPTKKGKFYGSPGDSNTLRWLGTGVWPTYSLKKQVYYKKVGEGRSDSCSCARPRSSNCIKQHIKEARELLEKELTRAFVAWKFDQMGEEAGSKSWTAKEEQRFGSLVKKNPLSNSEQRLWELASASFPRKSHKDLVSYYYNVYLIKRMRLLANSSAANHIDSDDDHNDEFLAG